MYKTILGSSIPKGGKATNNILCITAHNENQLSNSSSVLDDENIAPIAHNEALGLSSG